MSAFIKLCVKLNYQRTRINLGKGWFLGEYNWDPEMRRFLHNHIESYTRECNRNHFYFQTFHNTAAFSDFSHLLAPVLGRLCGMTVGHWQGCLWEMITVLSSWLLGCLLIHQWPSLERPWFTLAYIV